MSEESHLESLKGEYSKILKEQLASNETIQEMCDAEQLKTLEDLLTKWFGESTRYQKIGKGFEDLISSVAPEEES